MVSSPNHSLIDAFQEFYETNYKDEIENLCQNYHESRALLIDWQALQDYNEDIADDYINHPGQIQEYAEEALREHIPTDDNIEVRARVTNLPTSVSPEDLNSHHVNTLVAVEGRVKNCSEVTSRLVNSAFECQRCGTLTNIFQTSKQLQKPHECQGCERQGPFATNFTQSEFIDHQTGKLIPLANTSTKPPETLPVELDDDLAGELTASTPVRVNGILRLEDSSDSTTFDQYLEAVSVQPIDGPEWDQWNKEHLGITSPESSPAQDDLEGFVQRSRQVINTCDYLDEMNTKAKIHTPLLHLLGWNIFSPEVAFEYSGDLPHIDDKADYALFDSTGNPAVVVEAKRVNRNLDSKVDQLQKYMRLFGTEWGLISNGKRYIILKARKGESTPDEQQVLDCQLEELLAHRDALTAINRDQFE